MRYQRAVQLVLSIFVLSLVSATLGELVRAATGDERGCHAEGASCPDSSGQDHACSPACPCACCPGHAPVVAFAAHRFSLWLQPLVELQPQVPGKVTSKNIPLGIFRPPRA